MKRYASVLAVILVALVILTTGCSKEKKQQAEEITKLQGQVKELETQLEQKKKQQADEGLKAAVDQRTMEEKMDAMQVRLLHQFTEQLTVAPAAQVDNGWFLVSGERTVTLKGNEKAAKVRFYLTDPAGGAAQELLGEDTNGSDGWSWSGPLSLGGTKALWAEAEYAGGVRLKSAVLPMKHLGK